MKTAEEWRSLWVKHGHIPWPQVLKMAQADALRHAATLVTPDGNPLLAIQRIEAEAAKLEDSK